MAFVLGAFPWSEPDTELEKFAGPDPWQLAILIALRDGLLTPNEAIQLAVASGHGIGKSCLVAWIILWAFCTAPDTRGVVTANTETQLKTKTWAELGKWFNLFIAKEHFHLTATALLSKDPTRERTWRIDMVPWSEKNTEAFAGLHNKGKRVVLIMDEGSAIPDVIYEVAEGALTDSDTEILWLVFGNPTRNTGRFKECFGDGRFADAWKTWQIDSRTVEVTNKTQIAKWIKSYGEDSDFVRIRVRGVFPRTGEMEFFSAADIDAAMAREPISSLADPLALGVDVARYGSNNSVIFARKGRDAVSIPRKSFNGMATDKLADQVFVCHTQWSPDGIFIDGGGVGGGVVDSCRRMQLFVYEVQFGGKDDITGVLFDTAGEKYANKRAAMYGAARAWLKTGALPPDPELRAAMLAITYTFDKKDQILLTAKEDIMDENPGIILDDLDAFVLTFGGPLSAHANAGGIHHSVKSSTESDYNPYSEERMSA